MFQWAISSHYGRAVEFSNLDLSPAASASLDQMKAAIDRGEMILADAIAVAKALVRIDNDPQAVIDNWIRLPGDPPIEDVLAERVEGTNTVFVIVWETRPDAPAYVHEIGWEDRVL